MSRLLRSWISVRRGRRFTAAVTLVAYIASGIGLPLPVQASKKSGLPFPCMNHACGCQTAEQCWRGCCCFSAEEKLAWAAVHGIVPPDYASLPRHDEHARADCHSPCACRHDCQSHENKKTNARSAWVISIGALPCRGAAAVWTLAALAVPPGPIFSWTPLLPLVGLVSCNLHSWNDLNLSPQVPPPRPSKHA
jgi:hypothetical protein